jgi:hypothetical protein
VLTDVENNGTQETQGFIQVWASVRIKNPTSCVCRLYYDCLSRDSLYQSFYRLRGIGFTCKIPLVTVVLDPDSISTYHIYNI